MHLRSVLLDTAAVGRAGRRVACGGDRRRQPRRRLGAVQPHGRQPRRCVHGRPRPDHRPSPSSPATTSGRPTSCIARSRWRRPTCRSSASTRRRRWCAPDGGLERDGVGGCTCSSGLAGGAARTVTASPVDVLPRPDGAVRTRLTGLGDRHRVDHDLLGGRSGRSPPSVTDGVDHLGALGDLTEDE